MPDTKFTPGPWEVEKRDAASTGSVHYAVKTSYRPPEHLWSPRFITFMCGGLGDYHPSRPMADYRDDPQIDADAHLIAASPEMYEALKKAGEFEAALILQWADFWDAAPQALIDVLMEAQTLRNAALAKAVQP